jgi:gluconate 5-dehydrogenase
VNAIAPGFFPTKMTRGILEMVGDEARARRRSPHRRPEDLKGVVALFASDAARSSPGRSSPSTAA